MKILVMGTGAVGGYFGGVLARGGADVTLIARGENRDAIQKNGLQVESVTSGNFTVHPPVIERPDGSWEADLVLFCVKSYQSEEAVELLKPVVGGTTTILTLQNGIGSGELLAESFGRSRVLLGAAYVEAARKAPGVFAEFGGMCHIVFGEESGERSQRTVAIQDALQAAGMEAQLSGDMTRDLWNKLIYICALSGMTCITRTAMADVLHTSETLELSWRVMRETEQVALAMNVKLSADVVESTMADFQASEEALVSSMYQDLMAGNPLELAVINGAVSRLGKEVGIGTPVNDFIIECLAVADRLARSARK